MPKLKESTAFDCSILELPKINNEVGSVTSINSLDEISFDIKRVYYLYDVPGGESRGAHAHKELYQLIIAASGSFDVTVDDGSIKRVFSLSRPFLGLYMPPGLWRDLSNFSSGSICLVLASEIYIESDYIRDYNEFKAYKLKNQ